MKFAVLSMALCFPLIVHAAEPVAFAPSFAADQKEITTESLESEAQQFKALAEWRTATDMLENAGSERDFHKKELDRAVPLAKQGQMSMEKLFLAQYKYRKSVNDVVHLENELVASRALARVYKYKLISEGSPSEDHRLELIHARIDETRARLKCLQASADTISFELRLVQQRMANGQSLLKSSTLAESDLDGRVLATKSADARLKSAQHEIEVTQQALKGLEASRKRLENGA